MMSSSHEQPGGTNEPISGEDQTKLGAMKKHFLKKQLEGASEQAWRTGAPGSQEQGDPEEMSQSGGAEVQQFAATFHLRESQTAEPEIPERACMERSPSPVTSVISMKSDMSMKNPLDFKEEDKGIEDLPARPVSCMSSVSDWSDSLRNDRPNFVQEETSGVSAGGVQCDICPHPAVKACLTCRDSYCMTCIRPHYSDPDLEEHQLQDLPHQGRCEQHNKELEFYCRTDQSAVCSRCFLTSHKGHDIIEWDTVRVQSALQTQTIKEGVPPPGPIQFPSVQSNSVTLRWSPPEGTLATYRYKVTWRRGQYSRSIKVAGPEVVVEGLLPGEKYHFSVVTLGEDGHQSTRVEKSVHTEVPVPNDVTVAPGATCVSVKWAKPNGLEDKVSYLLQLFKKDEPATVRSFHKDVLDFSISGLQQDSEYTVQISTTLPNNRQSKPTFNYFRTEILGPEHLTVSSIAASSVHLSWEVSPEMEQIPYSFIISYWTEGTVPKSTSTESCSADITGLRPGTQYSVTVCTALQHGGKSKPASVQLKTGICLSDLFRAINLKIEEKITISSVLEMSGDMVCDRPAQSLTELPWTFLRKLMMCDLNARNVCCNDDSNAFGILNPLDLITAVFLCSDTFLQQEMVTKMSMCQFAVPLLLPNYDTQQSTLMLWAMRDIVKIYRPHSLACDRAFVESRIVEIDIPMVSFVRIGKSSLPKSKILNKLLSNPHQHYDTFVHHDMECGNVPRRISDGLVEVSWYLPCGNTTTDRFIQPVTMANLRGDSRLFKTQMSLLCQTSAAVFIFSDDPEDALNTLGNSDSKAELFLVTSSQSSNYSMETFKETCRKHKLKDPNFIVKTRQNEEEFMKMLWSCLRDVTEKTSSTVTVENMADIAHDVGFLTDEDCKQCVNARISAEAITGKITDIEKFKLDKLPLHGEMWKKISKSEKEICRMSRAGKDIEHHRSSLQKTIDELRGEQCQKQISDAVLNFIAGISKPDTECLYFLKWLKIQLDSLSRHHLSKLREQYKAHKNKQGDVDCKEMANLDKQISRSSLGPEHFFRELGQLYECAFSRPENDLRKSVEDLPGLCAQMLLNGFPVELVDGDASNIPVKWISEVLTQLHKLVDSKSRILVLTVLGVQGTGKSTLLNTMFGVQFAVSSGRCTKGAFMLVIKASEDLRTKLSCDFLMIIDTEGLKSPELAALDTSYEHDNELATLVIGLSDITIVNVAMENNTEMKDILQIVVHAFLRMKEVGKKPRCVFVHQNVSDLSAHTINMRDRNKMVEQLNEMTRAAAKMERREANTKFTDVMEYDPDKDSYYIPGLWYGTLPMAAVNPGYSDAVHKLKKSLIDVFLNDVTGRCDATEFLEWTQDLWDAVKFEDFIFNFKNSLVAEAYTRLCSEYNTWEWSLQKEINSWLQDKETYISNFGFAGYKKAPIGVLRAELDQMISDASLMLNTVEEKLLRNLEDYFSEKHNHVILVEKYKEDFRSSARCLRRETENFIQNSLHRAFDIREGMEKVNEINKTQTQTIEKEVLKLLQTCRESNVDFSDEDLDQKFENMWAGITAELSMHKLEANDLQQEVLALLMSNFLSKTGHSKNQLKECDLNKCGLEKFTVKLNWFQKTILKHIPEKIQKHRSEKDIREICDSIIEDCASFVSEKEQNATDFHYTFIKEILSRIDEKAKEFKLSEDCEVDLKLHICGHAYRQFQFMHYKFIENNNPQRRLEQSKSKFKEEFKDLFHKRDQCQKKAKEFTEEFLKPAVQDYVNRKLGPDIADEIMKGDNGKDYSTAKHFQHSLLKQMLLEDKYENYKAYTSSYESFLKMWIKKSIEMLSKDGKLSMLQKRHLSDIVKKITDTVTYLADQTDENTDIKVFIQQICTHLKELIFSGEIVNSFLILNTAKIEQFSITMREFVKQMKESMAQSYDNQREMVNFELLPFKPHDMLFKRVIGCGRQCPFCGTPCEAEGKEHKEHFASMHRPEGLGCYRWIKTGKLVTDICSSLVISGKTFRCEDTKEQLVPYKKYRTIYPNWKITGDAKVDATDYWKYVLMKFNKEFAEDYNAEPADIPQGWTQLTQQHALESLRCSFNIVKVPATKHHSIMRKLFAFWK